VGGRKIRLFGANGKQDYIVRRLSGADAMKEARGTPLTQHVLIGDKSFHCQEFRKPIKGKVMAFEFSLGLVMLPEFEF